VEYDSQGCLPPDSHLNSEPPSTNQHCKQCHRDVSSIAMRVLVPKEDCKTEDVRGQGVGVVGWHVDLGSGYS
jgi:hypothetical protein